MKTLRTAFLVLLLTGLVSAAAPAAYGAVAVAVGGPVGVDVFYSHLSPYGHWVERPSYGWMWQPTHVSHGWRPYTAGRWAYTDYGWTWVAAASEPWGWATYHYGRWYDDPEAGWEWMPGTDWGPSWVSWQQGGGYLGWAPLPPAVGWNSGVGLELGAFNLSVGIAPASYCFVPERSFLAANVGGYILAPGRNVAIFHETRNITSYGVVDHRVFNRSMQVGNVEKFTGQRVHEYRLANMNEARGARFSGNSLAMYHPAVERRANTPTPRDIAPRSVVSSSNGARRDVIAESHRPAAHQATHQVATGTRTNERIAADAHRSQVATANEHKATTVHHAPPAGPAHRAAVHHPAAGANQHQAVTTTHHQPAGEVHHHQAVAASSQQHRAAVTPANHRQPATTVHHAQGPPPQHVSSPPQHQATAHGAPPPKPNHEGGGGEHGGEHHPGGGPRR